MCVLQLQDVDIASVSLSRDRLSRRDTLDYKPLKFSSLGALIEDYKAAYEEIGHRLVKVVIGLPCTCLCFAPSHVMASSV